MTGSIWRTAFVAALFGIHPLHVESVAWVAERKDVLSGLFFMLTLIAYAKYVRRSEPASLKSKSTDQEIEDKRQEEAKSLKQRAQGAKIKEEQGHTADTAESTSNAELRTVAASQTSEIRSQKAAIWY